jgi:RNA recognition motif-containing protein
VPPVEFAFLPSRSRREFDAQGTSADIPRAVRRDPGPPWWTPFEEILLFKKLYVGNLSFSTTESELRDLFARHGSVESVKVIMDRETGRPRGFAFIEMDATAASDAIRALDGTDLAGRSIRVNEAQERSGGGGGGGGGPRGGGYGGGGGGGGRNRY